MYFEVHATAFRDMGRILRLKSHVKFQDLIDNCRTLIILIMGLMAARLKGSINYRCNCDNLCADCLFGPGKATESARSRLQIPLIGSNSNFSTFYTVVSGA